MSNSMRKTKWVLLLLAGGWIAATALFGSPPDSARMVAPREGFMAPQFTLQTLTGDIVDLEQLQGNIVVINFWTSWCPPCKAEMPALQRTSDLFKENGVIILAVNVTNQDSFADVKKFITELDITMIIPLDLDGNTTAAYHVKAFPTTYFIDQNGVIQKVIIGGPISEAVINGTVAELSR